MLNVCAFVVRSYICLCVFRAYIVRVSCICEYVVRSYTYRMHVVCSCVYHVLALMYLCCAFVCMYIQPGQK